MVDRGCQAGAPRPHPGAFALLLAPFPKAPLPVHAHCRATVLLPKAPSLLPWSAGPHRCAGPVSFWVGDQCILGEVMGWRELASQVCIFPVSQPNWKYKQPAFPPKSGQAELMAFWQQIFPSRDALNASGTKRKLGVNLLELPFTIGNHTGPHACLPSYGISSAGQGGKGFLPPAPALRWPCGRERKLHLPQGLLGFPSPCLSLSRFGCLPGTPEGLVPWDLPLLLGNSKPFPLGGVLSTSAMAFPILRKEPLISFLP